MSEIQSKAKQLLTLLESAEVIRNPSGSTTFRYQEEDGTCSEVLLVKIGGYINFQCFEKLERAL